MKTIVKFFILFILLYGNSLQAQNVAYIYGDISEDGDVPSGKKPAFHQMRLNDEGRLGLSNFKKAIEETGLTITEYYDAETVLNAEFLEGIDVLILASNQKVFSELEVNAVRRWVEKGGGVLAWSDSAFGGHHRKVGIANTLGRDSDNLIMTQFGVYFLTDNGGGNYLIKKYTEDHFINDNNMNGGVAFRGEGVSFIRISPPARALAHAQEGGLGGRLAVNEIDKPFNPETDVALAIAEIKKGRVLGLFDRNMLWNNGDGSQLSHSDNREFAQRMVLWAAGIEDNSKVSKRIVSDGDGINNPPVVKITHSFINDETEVRLVANIEDKDTDNIYPEISWKKTKGPGEVIFENNNPNTPNPIVTLTEKGTYVIVATVNDGEFTIKESVTVTRTK